MQDVRVLAREFLAEAWAVLEADHVVPRPKWDSHVHVGADYAGPDLMGRPAYEALMASLPVLYPGRFNSGIGRPDFESPTHYVFDLLEAVIAELGLTGEPFSVSSPTVAAVIEELVSALEASTYELVCCRVVSHLSTAKDKPVMVGQLEVAPLTFPEWKQEALTAVLNLIPGARGAFRGNLPFNYDPPTSLVIVRSRFSSDPWEAVAQLEGQIDRFLLQLRLVFGATSKSHWQISGPTTKISRARAHGKTFALDGTGPQLIQRVARLDGSETSSFDELSKLLDEVSVVREGKFLTSFDLAMDRFTRTYAHDNLYDSIVDLATSLEGMMLGGSKSTDEVGLRLKSRTAAMLSTDGDSAKKIFGDISELYDIRSRLVHGGTLTSKELNRQLIRLVPGHASSMIGISFAFAADRFRDLVRRAILSRLALAKGPDALWPFEGDTPVDAILSDDLERSQWREAWRRVLADAGLERSINEAPPAKDSLDSSDDTDQGNPEN